MSRIRPYKSDLRLHEAERALKLSSIALVGFLFADCILILLYYVNVSVPSSISDFLSAKIPAITRMLDFMRQQYAIYGKEIILTRLQIVKEIYALQWSLFTVFVALWLPWWLLQLRKIYALYSDNSHQAHARVTHKSTPWRMMKAAMIALLFVYYAFYIEVFQGNYEFSYYNWAANNVHVRNADFFRYAGFMFASLLFLSVFAYGVCIGSIALKRLGGEKNGMPAKN